jgi:hypothetical protein
LVIPSPCKGYSCPTKARKGPSTMPLRAGVSTHLCHRKTAASFRGGQDVSLSRRARSRINPTSAREEGERGRGGVSDPATQQFISRMRPTTTHLRTPGPAKWSFGRQTLTNIPFYAYQQVMEVENRGFLKALKRRTCYAQSSCCGPGACPLASIFDDSAVL